MRKLTHLFLSLLCALFISACGSSSPKKEKKEVKRTQEVDTISAEDVQDTFIKLMEAGDIYALQQDWYSALFSYEEARRISPENYFARYKVALTESAICQVLQEDCDIALNELTLLIRDFPETAQLYQTRSQLFLALGDTNLSIVDLAMYEQYKPETE